MKRILAISIIVLLLLTGCKSVETETVYVPVYPNWDDFPLIVEQRPPATIDSLVMPSTLHDIVNNSIAFQTAYYDWKDYATLVESYTLQMVRMYSP